MSIHDYINYVNPPAVHKYKHDNGDIILCVKFTDQISLRSAKQQYGYDEKNSNMSWRDTEAAGEATSNISGSGHGKRCPEGTVSVMEIQYEQVKVAGSVNTFLRRKMIDYSSMDHENDNYQTTGCRNVECLGFVLSDGAQNYLGQPIEQLSEYGKDQVEKLISIKKESLQGEAVWSLYIQEQLMGHWLGSLFSSLAESTNIVQYGGEVLHSVDVEGTPFSKTHMGSGHFPEEGLSKVAYIRDIQVHNSNNALLSPQETIIVRRPLCYNLTLGVDNTTPGWGHYMFFGGPGGDNPSCLN